MESYYSREEFENIFHEETSFFIKKYFKNIGLTPKMKFTSIIDKFFGKFTKSPRFFEDISRYTRLNTETVELLLKCCEEIAYGLYKKDASFMEKQNSDLQNRLRQALQKNKQLEAELKKKEIELKQKEQIILQNNDKIRKNKIRISDLRHELEKVKNAADLNNNMQIVSKSKHNRQKGTIVEVPINSVQIEDHHVIGNMVRKSRDIMFYDIPKTWKENDIISKLSLLGEVKRVRIKRLFKYQTVRAEMNLKKESDNLFKKGNFYITLGNHAVRWYNGEWKLLQRRMRDRWQLIKEVKNTSSSSEECQLRVSLMEKYNAMYVKFIKIDKKQMAIAYFQSEYTMSKALEKSIEENLQDIWKVREIHNEIKDKNKKETTGNIIHKTISSLNSSIRSSRDTNKTSKDAIVQKGDRKNDDSLMLKDNNNGDVSTSVPIRHPSISWENTVLSAINARNKERNHESQNVFRGSYKGTKKKKNSEEHYQIKYLNIGK
ncbi:hypothetical protein GLOIN_2v1643545 [Rhizophagus irregularis DAOM 181602=DAOM 197198]|nr:hypothetical protein GLOIN_2v1643545 [Rhizophagus irregularis DAOM 181602=DAOM 197198]CAG8720942.1 8647_t:CDS:1 [Rhizophagus irregularis]